MILTSQKKLNPQLWTNINNFDIYKKIFKNLKHFFIYSRCTFFYREHFFKFKGIEFLLFVSKLIFIFEDFKCFYFEKKKYFASDNDNLPSSFQNMFKSFNCIY